MTMAAGLVATVPPPIRANAANTSSTEVASTEVDGFVMKECQKIIQLRDEVLAGSHPRIKMTTHLVSTKQSSNISQNASPLPGAAAAPYGMIAPVAAPPTGPKSKQTHPAKLARINANAKTATATTGPQFQIANNIRSFNVNSQKSADGMNIPSAHSLGLDSYSTTGTNSSSIAGFPSGPRTDVARQLHDGGARAQIDPILLTKSKDLIKAETQLQRRRLESGLGDQMQQQRAAAKASHAHESLADFVLAEVLMEALRLVQASAPSRIDPNIAANASGADSDSADSISTFYSSKHDTPESHLIHRVADLDEDYQIAGVGDDSPYEPPMVMEASPTPLQPGTGVLPPSATSRTTEHRQAVAVQPIQHSARISVMQAEAANKPTVARGDIDVPMEIVSSQESGEASSSRCSGLAGQDQPVGQERLQSDTRHLNEHSFDRQQAPILRAHDLSPIAPQPAHVSPLATTRQPPILPRSVEAPTLAAPAQIIALRNDRSNGSSPDSSASGKPGKKGKKAKKRKADRMAANISNSPYIKAEPRSPSPVNMPQFSRPSKRLRHEQGQHPDQEPDGVVDNAQLTHKFPTRPYRDDRISTHDSPRVSIVRQDSRPIVLTDGPRYEREHGDDRRPFETLRYIRRVSPGAHAYQYAGTEVRTVRSVSQAPVDQFYPHYESRDPTRTIFRSAADRDRSRSPIMFDELPHAPMGPPQLPSTRLVIDEFGREYVDPSFRPEPMVIRRSGATRPVYTDHDEYYDSGRPLTRIIRRSVAPSSTSVYGEPEFVYERTLPPHAASTRSGSSRYEEEILYRGPASPAGYATTRRVVTRAEYAPEYRYCRERDYASGPSQSGSRFSEMRSTQDLRPPVEEQPREYIMRSATARPEMPVRQENTRAASVRPEPEPALGEHGAPIHLDVMPLPQPRVYSVRPMAPPHPPQQPQYARQWSEYVVQPTYGEQAPRGDDSSVTRSNVPREVYR